MVPRLFLRTWCPPAWNVLSPDLRPAVLLSKEDEFSSSPYFHSLPKPHCSDSISDCFKSYTKNCKPCGWNAKYNFLAKFHNHHRVSSLSYW